MAIGVDKDCLLGRVYWSDISSKNIYSVKYDGSDKQPFITEGIPLINFFSTNFNEHILFADIESPEGVAVDWISRRLYWTDSKKDTIEVAALDNPKNRAVIIKRDLVNPRGIAVDPHTRYDRFLRPGFTAFAKCRWMNGKSIYFCCFALIASCIGLIGIVTDRKSNGLIWMERNVAFYSRLLL